MSTNKNIHETSTENKEIEYPDYLKVQEYLCDLEQYVPEILESNDADDCSTVSFMEAMDFVAETIVKNRKGKKRDDI